MDDFTYSKSPYPGDTSPLLLEAKNLGYAVGKLLYENISMYKDFPDISLEIVTSLFRVNFSAGLQLAHHAAHTRWEAKQIELGLLPTPVQDEVIELELLQDEE